MIYFQAPLGSGIWPFPGCCGALVGHASACQASEARPRRLAIRAANSAAARFSQAEPPAPPSRAVCLHWWGMLQLARRAKLAAGDWPFAPRILPRQGSRRRKPAPPSRAVCLHGWGMLQLARRAKLAHSEPPRGCTRRSLMPPLVYRRWRRFPRGCRGPRSPSPRWSAPAWLRRRTLHRRRSWRRNLCRCRDRRRT